MLHIVFICNSASWGGLEINTIKFAQWFQECGHRVQIVANPNFKIAEEAQKQSMKVLPYPAPSHHKGTTGIKAITSSLRQHKPNAAILSLNQHLTLPIQCKSRGIRIPFFYLQQMEIGIPKRDLYHTLIYRFLDGWVAPLQVLVEQVQERTRYPKKRISRIPLSIDLDSFPVQKKEEARKLLGLPENEFLFGMIGRFDKHKGHRYFIEAVNQLHKEGFKGKGVIVGIREGDQESPYSQEIFSLIREMKMEKNIVFKPFSDHIATAFNALDVFVMPSPAETFGMVTVEALATGVPVVGFAALGTKEILQNGKYGLLASPKDSLEMSKQMVLLWKDGELRERLAKQGKAYVASTYSKETFCKKWEQLIHRFST